MAKWTVTYDRIGDAVAVYKDGVEVTLAEYAAHFAAKPKPAFGPGHAAAPACWPMLSDAAGVHPDQIPEAMERNKKHGVNVTYRRDGTAIIPDRGERRRLMKLEGFHDKSGGYGDG